MNKREQQRLKKQQKQQAAARKQQTQQALFKVGLYVVAPIFVIVLLFTLLNQGPTYTPSEVAENDHVRGDPSTPVTITVYADFQCPACATENVLMSRAWPTISSRAHMIFRHFPVTETHPSAFIASRYAEAAGRQDAFWEMHDILFANQGSWSTVPDPESEFDSYASALELDLEQLHSDMEADEVIQKVRNDQRGGVQAGVRGTPTIFINGDLVTFNTVTRLVDLVNQAYEDSAG